MEKKPDLSSPRREMTDEEKALCEEIQWHQPEYSADYRTWARRAYWSADECVALTFGKDPHQINWDYVEESCVFGISPFADDYAILRERIVEAQTNKELPER